MDADAVDGGAELREAIQQRFALAPVVVLLPVVAQRLHVAERNTLRPVVRRFLVRPPRGGETSLEVDELRVVDGNFERGDRVGHDDTRRGRLRAWCECATGGV